MGMLAAYGSTRGGFRAGDVLALRTAAIASALVWQERAATAEQRQQADEVGRTREVARELASADHAESALGELAQAAAQIVMPGTPELGQALVLRGPAPDATVVASVGARSAQFARALHRHIHHVMVSGRSVRFTLDEAAAEPERRHLAEAGIGAVALVPIPGADERFGVLAIGGRDGRPVTPDQLRQLALLADLGGLAVANATAFQREHRALETSQERLRELTLLHDATRTLSATLDQGEIERVVISTASRLVAVEDAPCRAGFFRVEDETASLVADVEAGSALPDMSDRELATVLAKRRAVAAPPLALAPVFVHGEPYGVVAVGVGDECGAEVLRRLEAIASLAELAIANAVHFDAMHREGERMAAMDDVKSKFLRLASHELRSPLAVLRGYLSMLLDGTFDGRPGSEVAEVYGMMDAKAQQMEVLVTQMLEAARLEDGRLRMDLVRLDLRQVVTEAAQSVRAVAGPEHELQVILPDEPVHVLADAWRVATILGNLLSNAVKYSPGGGSVRCTVPPAGDVGTVEVADRGLGIAEADMATLFTRFGRIVTTENSRIPGTGLGLYLSRELAQMQGGTLEAASQVGVGSTFTLTLPLAPQVVD
jgi:signal transduction histidine kinase